MELRVWVDGVQRIVCGVRLTTTCQEIVFVLAKATHQAGRFTMIERWRNNERLLSPNEQPLVTLQRWGDHMNEVEFILKKANSDLSNNQVSQQRAPQLPNLINNHDNIQAPQIVSTGNMRSSPMSPMQSVRNQQFLDQQSMNNVYQQGQYNLNRRPQTSLGPLTSSSSSVGFGLNYPQQQHQKSSALHPMLMTSSLSTSTLTNLPKPASNNISPANVRYSNDQIRNSSPSSLYGHALNGYQTRGEASAQQLGKIQSDQQVQQPTSKNHPFEELYSTINKKRAHNPPAVPAKPRVGLPMTSMTNPSAYPATVQAINNSQTNIFNGSTNSPSNLLHNNLRPRHPPGYSDYLEAIASRNSSGQSMIPSSAYVHNQHNLSNNSNHFSTNSNNSNANSFGNRYHDLANDSSYGNYCSSTQEDANDCSSRSAGPIRSRLGDSGLVINLGSAVNVRLPPSKLNFSNQSQSQEEIPNQMNARSVTEVGHDMLKMIEEQKRVLLNQKDELDRLDNDRDYWETKQNSVQAELINRIENEIHQLEELWRENQTQIMKLENQDLEREVQDLKSEQLRIEFEITQQKNKLFRCEDEISSCRALILKLESELASLESPGATSIISKIDGNGVNDVDLNAFRLENGVESSEAHLNGTISSSDNKCVKEARSSDDENDFDEDSEGDLSDDLNPVASDAKLRAAKEVAYVDKRGLISGIRSLKLDKSRALSRQPENNRSSDNTFNNVPSSGSPTPNDENSSSSSNNNNNLDNGCLESNGQYSGKTANNVNQYEFLMTL